MSRILRQLPQIIRSGQRAAYCSVVKTVGSTPQKAGAKLLILPTFQSVGTLGGGCVEAEARKQAAQLMQTGQRKLLQFQLDNDYGWDDGLICGGRMNIFIDLTDRPEDAELFEKMNALLDADIPAVTATVVESPDRGKLGQKLLIGLDGTRVGSLDEAPLLPFAVKALETHQPQLLQSDDKTEAVYVEAALPKIRLVIAGAGHVGSALARLANFCGFHVCVIDDRPEFANAQNIPDADEIVVQDLAEALRERNIDPMTFVVIVTRGHHHDEECLHAVINSNAGYIGMIGSRRKIKLIFDDLIEMGVNPDRMTRVHAPIGIDIASKTVPEIAVSIAAQLIQVRNTQKLGGFAEALASKAAPGCEV